MIGQPWMAGMQMAFHTKTGPVLQGFFNICFRFPGLQSQRIATEVNGFLSVDKGDVKLIAVLA